MKKTKMLLLLALTLVLLLALAGCGSPGEEAAQPPEASEPAPPEEPAEPETTPEEASEPAEVSWVSSEEHAGGCADCHVERDAETDHRLAAETTGVDGHPPVSNADATVKDCAACHQEGSPLAFGPILHQGHLEGAENHFVTNYGGACNQCHKLSSEGSMVVKGLEEAGTEFIAFSMTSGDQAPDGCATCHTNGGEGHDYRLAAETANVEGHPPINNPDATVADCMTCHNADGNMPFGEILHLAHYEGGEENHFTNYGSSCQNCHSLAEDGNITVKGL